MPSDKFQRGDQVTWKWAGKTVKGEVVKLLTEDIEIKGHSVKASKENPQYLVRSKNSGNEAAHKPESLTKDG